MSAKIIFRCTVWCSLCLSCGVALSINNETDADSNVMHRYDSITVEELNHPNTDTFLLWLSGAFLGKERSSRDYKALLSHFCFQDSLSAKDIEAIYPTSVEEMSWFYSQLVNGESQTRQKLRRIDTLMTLYADRDSLTCLSRFLNMYFYMDPRVVDRDWMGEWNLNRAMYSIIPDNKQSFKSYYDTLDLRYEWLTREWLYAYQNF